MSEVAKAEGITPTMGQSPFALARGQNFERVLFRNAAQRLRDALVRAGVLPDGAQGFSDLRLRVNGGPIHTLDEALKETVELLLDIAHGRGGERRKPAIIGGATVRLPGQVLLPEAILIMDTPAMPRTWLGVRRDIGYLRESAGVGHLVI